MHGGKRGGSGRPPGSNRWGETTKAVRIPLSRVHDVYAFLEKKTSEILCPLYSSTVKAGFPSPADSHIESHLDLNNHLIKHPAATFFVIADGDSMTNAGINSGDMLIVDRSIEALHGHIIIASIDGELTVKRLSRKNAVVQLLPANDNYPTINITDMQDIVIWGVVTYILHKAH